MQLSIIRCSLLFYHPGASTHLHRAVAGTGKAVKTEPCFFSKDVTSKVSSSNLPRRWVCTNTKTNADSMGQLLQLCTHLRPWVTSSCVGGRWMIQTRVNGNKHLFRASLLKLEMRTWVWTSLTFRLGHFLCKRNPLKYLLNLYSEWGLFLYHHITSRHPAPGKPWDCSAWTKKPFLSCILSKTRWRMGFLHRIGMNLFMFSKGTCTSIHIK